MVVETTNESTWGGPPAGIPKQVQAASGRRRGAGWVPNLAGSYGCVTQLQSSSEKTRKCLSSALFLRIHFTLYAEFTINSVAAADDGKHRAARFLSRSLHTLHETLNNQHDDANIFTKRSEGTSKNKGQRRARACFKTVERKHRRNINHAHTVTSNIDIGLTLTAMRSLRRRRSLWCRWCIGRIR
jgi:hypothetical protein